jgi:hypothetical protein
LITDTHCQARGGAAHRFGGLGLILGEPHHRKRGSSRYAPSFDRLGIGAPYGYGVTLAEIGLPPGADVDRESLERAAQESGWTLNHRGL